MKMIRTIRQSFLGRIMSLVFLGIALITVIVSSVVLFMSKNAFAETYSRSQEKVLLRIKDELNDFHESLVNMTEAIDSSWAFRLFFSDNTELDNVQNFQNIFHMEQDLDASNTSGIDRINFLIVGTNGNKYLSRTETIKASNEQILASLPVQKAMQNPDQIHYTYSNGAYTTTNQNTDVIIASKALYYRDSGEIYGVVLVTLTMDDVRRYYDYFVSENTDWYLTDADGLIMCSNRSFQIGKILSEEWYQKTKASADGTYIYQIGNESVSVLKQDLSYFDCSMYGVINNNEALKRLYNMPLLIMVCIVVGCIILLICLFLIQDTIRPLNKLVKKMSESRIDDFHDYVEVEGAVEIQKVAQTYNEMLDDIQSYIGELIETQNMQRKSEIKALQMQINPHYIYNTLASIKWLVYQNNIEKTTQTIDAFISLLRNTISNTDEFITTEQELVNIENYCLINHTRYGEDIAVEYEIEPECYDCMLPKMILQPFVENAFFHAFPSGKKGTIRILIREKGQYLQILVCDNGIGMDSTTAKISVQENKEHFSGIGIHNVQERIQLLFGTDYGIEITSRQSEGTTVTIQLPVMREKDEK